MYGNILKKWCIQNKKTARLAKLTLCHDHTLRYANYEFGINSVSSVTDIFPFPRVLVKILNFESKTFLFTSLLKFNV